MSSLSFEIVSAERADIPILANILYKAMSIHPFTYALHKGFDIHEVGPIVPMGLCEASFTSGHHVWKAVRRTLPATGDQEEGIVDYGASNLFPCVGDWGEGGARNASNTGEGGEEEVLGWISVQFLGADWAKKEDVPKKADEEGFVEVERPKAPHGMNLEFAIEMFPQGYDRVHEGHLGGRAHAALKHLMIAPSYQRQGVGSALLCHAFSELRLDEHPVYLGTQSLGRGIYQRWGFKDLEHFDLDLAKHMGANAGYGVQRCYCMLREPESSRN